jgi:hypothetical protein
MTTMAVVIGVFVACFVFATAATIFFRRCGHLFRTAEPRRNNPDGNKLNKTENQIETVDTDF